MPLNLPRRTLLGGMASAALAAPAAAASKRGKVPAPISSLPVWNGHVPGGVPAVLTEQEIPRSPTGPADDTAFLHVTQPRLLHCRPAQPNGAAILLVPGGSYARVAIGHGGAELLRAFASAGYSTFLLKYRLPGDPWQAGPDAPLQDAQRAMRVISGMAQREGFDPARVAVWGGSAGGHLAARLANTKAPAYTPIDALDELPFAVRAAILLYPVNLMAGDFVHQPSKKALLANRKAGDAMDYSAQGAISPQSPPTFVAHALDDTVVPVENGLAYFKALRDAKVPAELHVQETGGHGFGWNRTDAGLAWDWPKLALAFIHRHGA
ncbi:MAG: alpha/beta hydrolase [Novosphingobium sp.]